MFEVKTFNSFSMISSNHQPATFSNYFFYLKLEGHIDKIQLFQSFFFGNIAGLNKHEMKFSESIEKFEPDAYCSGWVSVSLSLTEVDH